MKASSRNVAGPAPCLDHAVLRVHCGSRRREAKAVRARADEAKEPNFRSAIPVANVSNHWHVLSASEELRSVSAFQPYFPPPLFQMLFSDAILSSANTSKRVELVGLSTTLF